MPETPTDETRRETSPTDPTGPVDPEKRARDLALWRISVREYGARELARYLERKGIEKHLAQRTVEALEAERLVDDRRYARATRLSMLVSLTQHLSVSKCFTDRLL
jgi:SOS response regulatory protein OraA/RecX